MSQALLPAATSPVDLVPVSLDGRPTVLLITGSSAQLVDLSPYGCEHPAQPAVLADRVYVPCRGVGRVVPLDATGGQLPPVLTLGPGDPILVVDEGKLFATVPGTTQATMVSPDGTTAPVPFVRPAAAAVPEIVVTSRPPGREPPPTPTTAQSCTRILLAARQARARAAAAGTPVPTCAVAFNYRYNPTHVAVRGLLAGGEIGEIGSVHFEWLLDVRHGADYFRRWHRDAANSGGLLVHKSSHHFDLVNWWLSARPTSVYAASRLFFYGPRAGAEHGYDCGYDRAHGSPASVGDPFALRLDRQPRMRELYLDAEDEDGYVRDRNVFAPGVSIHDDMAVLVRYDSGATMTYHLNAYAPWEGYRLMVNGSRGRLELEVVETAFVSPPDDGGPGTQAGTIASLYPGHSGIENGHTKLTVHPFWRPPRSVEIPEASQEAHGGGDARLTADLFSGSALAVDPLGRRASEIDGALALLTGLAANASAAAGRPFDVAELIDPTLLADTDPQASPESPEES